MKCEDIQKLLPDYLSETLDSTGNEMVVAHLASCETCRAESNDMKNLWGKLGDIPKEEPGSDSRTRFDAMLNAYSHGLSETPKNVRLIDKIDHTLSHIMPSRPIIQAAAAVIFIVLGVFSGRMIQTGKHAEEEALRLRTEMSEMRQLLTVSLMSQSSALDRLQGVTMSSQLTSTNDDIPVALIKTLNNDQNVNVRLAAVDALSRYSDVGWVRSELVTSLTRSQPPHVQISLIEMLVEMKETSAVEVFETLLENDDTMDVVKKRARKGIDNMI